MARKSSTAYPLPTAGPKPTAAPRPTAFGRKAAAGGAKAGRTAAAGSSQKLGRFNGGGLQGPIKPPKIKPGQIKVKPVAGPGWRKKAAGRPMGSPDRPRQSRPTPPGMK